MNDTPKPKPTLTLGKKLELKKTEGNDQVRQSFAHGRSKTVTVEVKKKRIPGDKASPKEKLVLQKEEDQAAIGTLTQSEIQSRLRAIQEAMKDEKNNEELRLEQAKAEEQLRQQIAKEQEKAIEEAKKLNESSPHEKVQPAEDDTIVLEEKVIPTTVKHVDATIQSKDSKSVDTKNNEKPTPSKITPSSDEPRILRHHDSQRSTNDQRSGGNRYNKDKGTSQQSGSHVSYHQRHEPQRAGGGGIDLKRKYPPKPGTQGPQETRIIRAPSAQTGPKKPVTGGKPVIQPSIPELQKTPTTSHQYKGPPKHKTFNGDEEDEGAARKVGAKVAEVKKSAVGATFKKDSSRKLSRATLTKVLDDNGVERTRSIAALKRAREKLKMQSPSQEAVKVVREVIIPDTITVGELANRMAVRGADVVKALMKLGMLLTVNQAIDADTAELLCSEFGHSVKRVSDSDIELGLSGDEDASEDLVSRAPVVTVMGHVDHGKTSLLDALRETDVVSGEAGGITQHIGAYQVTMKSGKKITFIDTPGHAAFTEMRSRGANITDVVILVVAADDGIMPQTIEAINHAKAANVPIVVAINKIDKPEANPERVKNELLNHNVVLEDFGGETLAIEVSAKQRLNLEKLEEAILLQAEVLDLKANPKRAAQGVIIESRVDRGRGIVATVLVQKGTIRTGDIFVAGKEWGKVRLLNDDHGHKLKEAFPTMPVEVLGFNGLPTAGEELFVVESEPKAREIAEYRLQKEKEAKMAANAKSNMEKMMSQIAAGDTKELNVVIKTDVQGSLEALTSSLMKLSTNEVAVRVLHGAVGGINESDVTLARASSGVIIGFNVRANPQARDMAKRDAVDIQYYSIIYNVIDDIKAALGGLLSPTLKEKFLGYAEIREVFNITKFGKVAGCYVTEGIVKRGAKVRLLRDNVVIHEGTLKTLRRFKDEVKEVRDSFECGMAFENYDDIKQGDVIECFEIEHIQRQL